ncbi:MAG TPA: hypothetical protein VFF28_04705 [Candidatus Nanoarchaeia archaeon]|nr:hypothetical protein [Candidatus Nanoarchaeia archaeon]
MERYHLAEGKGYVEVDAKKTPRNLVFYGKTYSLSPAYSPPKAVKMGEKRLKGWLRDQGISPIDITAAFKKPEQEEEGLTASVLDPIGRLGKKLTDVQAAQAHAYRYRTPYDDLSSYQPSSRFIQETAGLVNGLQPHHNCLPLGFTKKNELAVAISDPGDMDLTDTINTSTSYKILFVASPADKIEKALKQFYPAREPPRFDEFM